MEGDSGDDVLLGGAGADDIDGGSGADLIDGGAGADTMKRIAAPMIGGIFTSFLLELLVYPGIYEIWKWNFVLKRGQATEDTL